jgi:hypothetical protein
MTRSERLADYLRSQRRPAEEREEQGSGDRLDYLRSVLGRSRSAQQPHQEQPEDSSFSGRLRRHFEKA